MSWFDIIKRKNTRRKKLSLNRKVNGSPVSFTNERQKTKERRNIQDMVNSSAKEQPRDVMNQKDREETVQEERNEYEQRLEDMQFERYRENKEKLTKEKKPMDRVSTTASKLPQDEEAAKRTEENEAELLARLRARNKKARGENNE